MTVTIHGAVATPLIGLILGLLAITTAVAGTRCPAKENTAPSSAKPETAPALDLVSLEKRLRETHAIGVFTKIALKNQVEDLLEQFRAFHQGRRGASLTKLREQFNLLFLKVLSLVQDNDPGLARDIASSREAIWNFLTDPAEFAKLTGGNAR